MADEIREYLKAAQDAEIRGETSSAVELLTRVASLYRSAGKAARAVQVLRHVQRLGGDSPALAEELRQLEGGPDVLVARVAERSGQEAPTGWAVSAPGAAEERAPALPTARERRWVERGPTLADPGFEAWCSFCCRPTGEVGQLVAGPAGAFICLGCLRDSTKLLGREVVPEAPPRASGPPAARAHPQLELVGQLEAVRVLEDGLRQGLGWILLVGPEGSGKTTWLLDLERRGLGHYVEGAGDLPVAPVARRLLLDGLDGLGAEQLLEVCCRAGRLDVQVVLALRGALEPGLPPPLTLQGGNGKLSLLSSEKVEGAARGRLPREIAEKIGQVACFQAQRSEALVEVARRMVAAREPALALSEDALRAIAGEAARSSRGGHELRALIDRIPAGAWELETPPRPARGAKGPGRKGRR